MYVVRQTMNRLIKTFTLATTLVGGSTHHQYNDYITVMKKEDKGMVGITNFQKNLEIIEQNNRDYGRCKMFLTQHSDAGVGYDYIYIRRTDDCL